MVTCAPDKGSLRRPIWGREATGAAILVDSRPADDSMRAVSAAIRLLTLQHNGHKALATTIPITAASQQREVFVSPSRTRAKFGKGKGA